MTEPFFIPLWVWSKDETASLVVVTYDGKPCEVFINHPDDLTENGDAIQDLMIRMLKYEEAKVGTWVWKIFDNWTSICGNSVELGSL